MLKHNIKIQPSFYAGCVVFSLYFFIILSLLLFSGVSWLSTPLYICLCLWAVKATRKVAQCHYQVQISEAGDLQIKNEKGKIRKGKIKTSSYYNRFFLSLHLQQNDTLLQKKSDYSILIYRDALSDPEYHLLARLINTERQI